MRRQAQYDPDAIEHDKDELDYEKKSLTDAILRHEARVRTVETELAGTRAESELVAKELDAAVKKRDLVLPELECAPPTACHRSLLDLTLARPCLLAQHKAESLRTDLQREMGPGSVGQGRWV